MRRHLLVVLEKKIKISLHKVKYYRWRHNNFSQMTQLDYKHVYNRAKSDALCLVAMLCTFDRNGFSHHVTNTIGGATV